MDEHTLRGLAALAKSDPIHPNAWFPPSLYYRFLGQLASYMAPALCVELGTCGGGASLYMAKSDPRNRVVSVDVSNSYPEQIAFIERTYSNFEFWRMDSVEAALEAAISETTYPVQLLFIDTIHTEQRTMAEFDAWRPLLADNAVVVLDDLYRDGMINAWERIPGKKLRLDFLHIGGSPTDGGFGVIWRPGGWR